MENKNAFKDSIELSETISKVKFANNISNLLIATAWDCSLNVFNIDFNNSSSNSLSNRKIFDLPQLDCCFDEIDNNYVYSVGMDKEIKKINIENLSQCVIGSHAEVCNNIVFNREYMSLITSGKEGQIKIWDYRNKNVVNTCEMDMNICDVIISGTRLVLTGIANDEANLNIIKILNFRNLSIAEKIYESPLKAQTTSVCPIINGEGFVIGSIEGKIGVEYFDKKVDSNIINNNYVFKCHREESESKIITYPIFGLCFHPVYNYFFSGGGDKIINGWDNSKRKKFFKSSNFPSPINNLSINKEGTHLAIASSYLPLEVYSNKANEDLNNPQHRIFIKSIENILPQED